MASIDDERREFADEIRFLADVAEWVKIHYKVNFDTEPEDRRTEWIQRYKESNEY